MFKYIVSAFLLSFSIPAQASSTLPWKVVCFPGQGDVTNHWMTDRPVVETVGQFITIKGKEILSKGQLAEITILAKTGMCEIHAPFDQDAEIKEVPVAQPAAVTPPAKPVEKKVHKKIHKKKVSHQRKVREAAPPHEEALEKKPDDVKDKAEPPKTEKPSTP